MIPFVIPCKLLGPRLHMFTFIIWGVHRLLNTVYTHSGYEFPWFPTNLCLFWVNASYHDYHHSHNVGNFGSMFTLWDSLLGANKVYFKHINDYRGKPSEKQG